MSEEIQKTIDYLTQKFGSTGAELWQAIVAQMRFDGWIGIGYFVLCSITVITLIYVWKKCGEKDEKENWSDDRKAITYIPLGFLIVALLLGCVFKFFDLGDNISKINNPTYWAAKEILKK